MIYPLPAVTSKETAESFLSELHKRGHLYHPDESTFDCLSHSGLAYNTLIKIDLGMQCCFEYLPDPCETALQLINAVDH
jgi:hypothetical protein